MLYNKITEALTPKNEGEKKQKHKKKEMRTFEHLLPNLTKEDLQWGGLILAGLGKGHDVRVGFSRGNMLRNLLSLLFLAAAGYFVWTIGSVQILGLWNEIAGVFW